jgi:EmrB/QacA subfamily drug resistance transporter
MLLNFTATLSLAFPFYSAYVALPRMMVTMSANLDDIQWVFTGFSIAQTVMMPLVGWLSNRLGLRRFFMLCLLGTIVGSIGSGLAWNTTMLISCRILQGMGAGPLAPLSTVIMFDAFPPGRRGLALGINSTNWAIGALIALPLGSYLIETIGWRTIFFCGVPWGLLSLVLAWRALPPGTEATSKRLDFWGVVTLIGFLVPLLVGLSQGQRQGWDSTMIIGSFALAILSGVAFVCCELCCDEPLVDLRLFTNFPFAMACLVRFLNHIGFNAHSLLIALFLQVVLDYTPLHAGLTVLPSALAVAPASLLIGRLTDRCAPRLIFLSGLAMMALGVYGFTSVNAWTPVVQVMMLVMVVRVGSECLFSPLSYVGMRLLPVEAMRMGSGVLGLMWSVGGSIGNAATAVFLHQRQVIHDVAMGQDYTGELGDRVQVLQDIQHLLQGTGSSTEVVDVNAPDMILQHYLHQEASVAAFQDCFWLTAVVYVLTMLPALLIRPRLPERAD